MEVSLVVVSDATILRTTSGSPWSEWAVADADRERAVGEGVASAEVASIAGRGGNGVC